MQDDGALLYDSIMGEIEPELTTANAARLEALVAKDTPEQRKARAARYTVAFAEYERRFAARQTKWDKDFAEFKRVSMRIVEEEVKKVEADGLSAIEQSMSTAV